MYVRRGIDTHRLLADSWRFLVATALWSAVVVYLNEFRGYHFLSIPIEPVSTIGIAVALYLGFKTASAYGRWSEARQVWGDIVNRSRDWGASVQDLIYAPDKTLDPAIRTELTLRHLAWVNALAYYLRSQSHLKVSGSSRAFGHRISLRGTPYEHTRESYRQYLSAEEAEDVEKKANIPLHILRQQDGRLRDLALEGFLDSYRLVAVTTLLGAFYTAQGACERIKNTPFPRQVANFGLVFTWVFIVLLPLAFVDIFASETQTHGLSLSASLRYVLIMVPFTVLIAWVFFIMEKVSDSLEDPFEGGVADVPILSLCRVIEIDLKQMADDEDVPPPREPIDGVLY